MEGGWRYLGIKKCIVLHDITWCYTINKLHRIIMNYTFVYMIIYVYNHIISYIYICIYIHTVIIHHIIPDHLICLKHVGLICTIKILNVIYVYI